MHLAQHRVEGSRSGHRSGNFWATLLPELAFALIHLQSEATQDGITSGTLIYRGLGERLNFQ
jgi:hypothetical protein